MLSPSSPIGLANISNMADYLLRQLVKPIVCNYLQFAFARYLHPSAPYCYKKVSIILIFQHASSRDVYIPHLQIIIISFVEIFFTN